MIQDRKETTGNVRNLRGKISSVEMTRPLKKKLNFNMFFSFAVFQSLACLGSYFWVREDQSDLCLPIAYETNIFKDSLIYT